MKAETGSGSTLKKEAGSRSKLGSIMTYWGSGSIFHKTWGRDVEAEALWIKKLEVEANSEVTNFIWSWKRKQKYSTASTTLFNYSKDDIYTHLSGRSNSIGLSRPEIITKTSLYILRWNSLSSYTKDISLRTYPTVKRVLQCESAKHCLTFVE